MDYIILTNPDKCIKCMSCIRACEVNSNIVKEDHIDVVPELCIVCGSCIESCPEGARFYLKQKDVFYSWIGKHNIFAIVAPSYPAHYDDPYAFVGALKNIGIKKVYEVAIGAEISSMVVAQELKSGKKIIASPCPTVVNYIKKWMPELTEYLSKAVSPMIATAIYLKKHYKNAKVVFIGPCISKKREITDEEVKGIVDLSLTFEEMDEIFKEKGINLKNVNKEKPDVFDELYGMSYPVLGGMAKTVGYYLEKDIDVVFDVDTVIIEGKTEMVRFLKRYLENIKNGREDNNPAFVEILYCDGGCIAGPGIRNDIEVFEKRKRVVKFMYENISLNNHKKLKIDDIDKYTRKYTPKPVDYKIPPEEEINKILEKIGMLERPLNCGSCGYHTCRERAIAVYNGLMPWDLCIQYQMRSQEAEHRRKIIRIRRETIEHTKYVIEKQMEVAQNIASLLGETVAETKASLTKVLRIVAGEESNEESEI